MSKIKVHILNFHGITSHIEIVLENTSAKPHTYYGIDRYEEPARRWSKESLKGYIKQASSTYTFEIDADPYVIKKRWIEYWYQTRDDASTVGNNCAVAAQWFLTNIAAIPEPNLSNVSWNHLILGIVWPSFIPCPVTLPGRIMSNAKFHMEARTNPQVISQYTRLFLYTSMALTILVFAASVFALVVAATILSGGIAGLAITACAAVGVASTYGFFKAHNILSAENISGQFKKTDEQPLLIQEMSMAS